MKKIMSAFIIMFFPILALAIDYKPEDIKTCGEFLCDLNDAPINGVLKRYHADGRLALEVPYVNGKVSGLSKTYYGNGSRMEIPYLNGKEDGIVKIYHDNGILAEEQSFKDGKKDGVHKSYSKGGKLTREVSYTDEELNGVARTYSDNGDIIAETNYSYGKIDGISKRMVYANNKLWYTSESTYNKGVIEKIVVYSSENQITAEIIFKDGAPFIGYTYDKDGNKVELTGEELQEQLLFIGTFLS